MMEDRQRYSKAMKAEIIDEINELKSRLKSFVFEKKSIPAGIINASLKEVQAYKLNCEMIGADRHVKGQVKDSWTGKKLIEIKGKLNGYCDLIFD